MTNKPEIALVKKIIAGFVSLVLGRKVVLMWGDSAGMMPNGTIMLPPPTTGDAAQIAALTRMAIHEAGHSTHTDPGCMQRLTAEELMVFNLIEDPRMEMEQRKLFPGARLILSRGLDQALDTILSRIDLQTDEGRTRALQLDILVRGYQAAAPQHALAIREQAFYELSAAVVSVHQRQAIDAAIAEIPNLKSSLQAEELAIRLNRQLREPSPVETQVPHAEPEPEAGPDAIRDAQVNEQIRGDDEGDGRQGGGCEDDAGGSSEPDSSQAEEGVSDKPADPADRCTDDADSSQQQTPGDAGQESGEPEQGELRPAGEGADAQANAPVEAEEGPQSTDAASGQSPAADAQAASDHVSEGSEGGSCASGDLGQPTKASSAEEPGLEGQQVSLDDSVRKAPPWSNLDLGELLRESYETRYGKPPSNLLDTNPVEVDQETINAVGRAIELAGGEQGDLGELVAVAMAQLLQAEQAEQPDESLRAKKAQGGLGFASATCTAVPLNIRLEGVQGKLVRVLLRELQDKQRQPAKYSQAGGQVAVNRFWRLGRLADTKVFRIRKQTRGVEAAVSILLDRSGSMDETIETAAAVSLAFSLALQRIGNVTTAVSMFPGTSDVTENIQSFGESAQQAVRRGQAIKASGGTPTGSAILQALPALLAQRKDKRILLIITDDGPDNPALLSHALAAAEKNGVDVIGVGVGCDIRFYIPNSVAINSVEALPDAMEVLFREKVALRLAA